MFFLSSIEHSDQQNPQDKKADHVSLLNAFADFYCQYENITMNL